jgi:ATP phosphoribosyltransferase
VKEEILTISTLLVANRASYKLRSKSVRSLVEGLRAARA